MQTRPLTVLAALAAATTPELFEAGGLEKLKTDLRNRFAADPMGTMFGSVAVGAWAFYLAERGQNPKVTSYYDALLFVSTSMSVGYSDTFAKTEAGKGIASLLMTYGPAMATRALDEPNDASNADLLEKLDEILKALAKR